MENNKQETLEEVAEKYVEINVAKNAAKLMYKEHFIAGAKWQQERSYSEEDMKSFADWCRNGLLNIEYSVDKLDEHLENWENFKKK